MTQGRFSAGKQVSGLFPVSHPLCDLPAHMESLHGYIKSTHTHLLSFFSHSLSLLNSDIWLRERQRVSEPGRVDFPPPTHLAPFFNRLLSPLLYHCKSLWTSCSLCELLTMALQAQTGQRGRENLSDTGLIRRELHLRFWQNFPHTIQNI